MANDREIKPYKFYLLPKQLEFLFGIPENKFTNKKKNSIPLDVSCYQGGFGSGKTWCGSLRGILYCLKYPGIRQSIQCMAFTIDYYCLCNLDSFSCTVAIYIIVAQLQNASFSRICYYEA